MAQLILDADGVFMNEAPYWKTALATALVWHGIDPGPAEHWNRLASACFEAERIQRVTKTRRCNSNWDLSAVMIRALDSADAKDHVQGALGNAQWRDAACALAEGMHRLYSGDLSAVPPLAAFGIDRDGEFFRRVVARYQDVFQDRAGLDWPFPRHELAAPAEHLQAVLGTFQGMGYTLGVCTSRDRDETLLPMEEFGILSWFDRAAIATHDDALEAQRRTGIRPLQKPHWFLLACALLGREAAVDAVLNGSLPGATIRTPHGSGGPWREGADASDAHRSGANGRRVYVGDTSADFQCARSCQERGLRLQYIHIDCGLTGEADLKEIRQDPVSLGIAPDLAGVVALLRETRP